MHIQPPLKAFNYRGQASPALFSKLKKVMVLEKKALIVLISGNRFSIQNVVC